MFRYGCVRTLSVLLLALQYSTAIADEPQRILTRDDIKRDLFASDPVPSGTPLFPMQSGDLDVGRKSVGLAVLYSLLVPGLGEYYAGDFSLGKYLAGIEAGLWITYVTFDVYGSSLRDDARAFAITHASILPTGKDDQFYVDVGNFLSVHEFNDKRLRERSPERLYHVEAGEGWQWDSEANRVQYKDTRISADNVLNNRKFVVTAIIINHVISAINAARAVIAHNREVGALGVRADVMGGMAYPHGIMLTISKQF